METEIPPPTPGVGKGMGGNRAGRRVSTSYEEKEKSSCPWIPLSFLDLGYPPLDSCSAKSGLHFLLSYTHFKLESFRSKNSKGENYLPGLI